MSLRIDYENVRLRAQEISDVIQVLSARKIDLQNTSNSLHNAWEGEASNAFKSKLDELIQELNSEIKEMSSILQEIITVADNIKKEDERLANEVAGTSSSNARSTGPSISGGISNYRGGGGRIVSR